VRAQLTAALFAVAALAGARAPGVPAQATTDVNQVLSSAAAYLAKYERDVTAVVAHEDYFQNIPFEARRRRLKSDLVVVADGSSGWVEFRDVFEVDGKPVRDRDDRVAKLFMTPNPNAFAQARKIVEESARFNISPSRVGFVRTLNVPLTALRFLRGSDQRRSVWELTREADVEGRRAHVIRFKEQALPRLIGSKSQTPAGGTFWIDAATGAVLHSELGIAQSSFQATITVDFAEHPTIRMWLPASMTESYRIISAMGGRVDGKATYSNFRQFKVDTSIAIK
jgi:hypothetical protein